MPSTSTLSELASSFLALRSLRRQRNQNVKAPMMRAQTAMAAMMMPAVAPAPSLGVGGGGILVMLLPGPVELVLFTDRMGMSCWGTLLRNTAEETEKLRRS